mmetsp:Transcript_9347/g.10868  ORF Transcript_9347/g.10868 Transcript_9347/m.10868 type:complete len:342 (-) Transcript_9347:31-1056(-)
MRVFGASEEEVIVKDEHVTPSDVLSGRGHGVASHQGNIYYASLIKERKKEYQNKETNCKRKKEIALEIVNKILAQQPTGRFLKTKTAFVWVVKNEQFAVMKVAQALREKPKPNKSSTTFTLSGSFTNSLKSSLKRSLGSFRSMKGPSNNDQFVEASYTNDPPIVEVSRNMTNPAAAAQQNMQRTESYRRPEKKSFVGSGQSRRRMMKWMTSLSRLQLITTSVGSINVSDRNILAGEGGDGVVAAMELLSSDGFDKEENEDSNAVSKIASPDEKKLVNKNTANSSFDSATEVNDAAKVKGENVILGREESVKFREAMLRLSEGSYHESMRNLNISTRNMVIG